MADNFVTAEVTIPHDGNWIMKIDPPNIFSTRQGVTAAIPSPGAELYVKADIYIPSSAEGFFPGYTDVLCIQDEVTGAHNSWQALTLHTSVGILYFWDYGTSSPEAIEVTYDEWHEIECAIRHLGGVDYETAFKVNGIESSWIQDGFVGAGPNWENIFIGAENIGDTFSAQAKFFIDNVEVAQDNWVSSGGTVIFSDDFNTGDFTAWGSTVASPLISPNVEETLYLGSIYARGEFYIPTANYADMVNNDGNFKHYVFGIIAEGDDPEDMAHAWGIARDGTTLYWQDYFEFFGTDYPITPDTWHVLELAIRPGSVTNWEANCKVDGVEGTWQGFGGPLTTRWDRILAGSIFAASSNDYILIDNVSVATNDWLSESGTPLFQDSFETGNFNGWDSTTGTPTVIAKP